MADEGFDTGRFGRLLVLIGVVTALSVLTSAQRLDGRLFRLAVMAIGAIAVITAMIGVLIAMSAAYDAGERPRANSR
jgi:hypothetical protein